jgi:hypothetical protein
VAYLSFKRQISVTTVFCDNMSISGLDLNCYKLSPAYGMLGHSPLHFRNRHVVKDYDKHLNANISHSSVLTLVKHGFVIVTSHIHMHAHACIHTIQSKQ